MILYVRSTYPINSIMIKQSASPHPIRPSLVRYLGCLVYDCLLLMAVLFFATGAAVLLNQGKAFGSGNPFFIAFLFFVSYLFYGWFWTHGGQTLGMQSWKIKLFSLDGKNITWRQAALRFVAGLISLLPLGLGLFWRGLGKDLQSWPDMASKTELRRVD